MKMSKLALGLFVVMIVVGVGCCAGATMMNLTANLGNVTVKSQENVIITSAEFNGNAGTIAANGQSVTFDSSNITNGTTTILSLTVMNNGGVTTASLGTPSISGAGSSLTFTETDAPPSSLDSGASHTYEWTVTATAAGTVTPTVSISWS